MGSWAASLRKRSSLNELVKAMPVTIRETSVDTHDLDLSIGHIGAGSDPNRQRRLRCLLLTASYVSPDAWPHTKERIQRLALQTGGQDIALLVVDVPAGMHTEDAAGGDTIQSEGVHAYLKLQSAMVDLRLGLPQVAVIPPVPARDIISFFINRYIPALCHPSTSAPVPSSKIQQLRQCTVKAPMSTTTAFYISDIFENVADLALDCQMLSKTSDPAMHVGTVSIPFGQRFDRLNALQSLISPDEFRDIVEFWRQEWTL